MFQEQSICQRAFLHYGCCIRDPNWPQNPEVQWRLLALSRGLGLPIPKPFRAPFIPGITVMIPHYGETILEKKDSLYGGRDDDIVPLMDWLKARYEDEWHNFDARMQAKNMGGLSAGSNWDDYSDEQWEKICGWSSMRLQTLFRTVAGMMLYHPALQCHYEEVQGVGKVRGEKKPALADVWTPNDCFNCIVSMQQYGIPGAVNYGHVNKMFAKFPSSLKVAFIDFKENRSSLKLFGPAEKNIHAEVDKIHPRQKRRYFSCLVDGQCSEVPGSNGRRKAKYTVELPGYPILGDGKSDDNQNHAIIFLRGIFSQCIDANQGGYFEQMLMLPCVLGEFRTIDRGDDAAKQIIGLPEAGRVVVVVANKMGAHCKLIGPNGSELTSEMLCEELDLTAVTSPLDPLLKMLGLLSADAEPFAETMSREDLEKIGLTLGREVLETACRHGGAGHLCGYLQVAWPLDRPWPSSFEKGYMKIIPSRQVLPAGTQLRLSCAPGTHGEEGLKTLSKPMTLADLLKLRDEYRITSEERKQLLQSPAAVSQQAEEVCRLIRVLDFEPQEEHITSDIGSVGDFAAGSEVAFGTILQRTYSVLGARMHYGHPDIMNKQYMMQQGGVSKATKTINLSEDIFAGMDFTLRGQGRSIKHCEYFHVAKGRDLGFNTVLGFFSKLSSGAGEQILTRQMFRLGQLLHLPEAPLKRGSGEEAGDSSKTYTTPQGLV
ncbi:1 [Durusdinium trenchii]|uniref:1 n=1 Tax=Durusdinium trenchii TaxID=1381693 RepID=A0ABP0HTR3_9DINO